MALHASFIVFYFDGPAGGDFRGEGGRPALSAVAEDFSAGCMSSDSVRRGCAEEPCAFFLSKPGL
jgi:hypothetical protein